ncbi:MAG: hypothetical protein GY928_23505 [Colwellia sp.]|nr:hypothetical protein [Colwellia sp.]
MSSTEIFNSLHKNCKLGIKAFQNVSSSETRFTRMLALFVRDDEDLLSALFSSAVVSYAKPFLRSKMGDSQVIYPIKDLKKKCASFEIDMHNHLIKIRNTVVAHDDFVDIDPRLLQVGVTAGGLFIPTTMIMSNKCISFPTKIELIQAILIHVSATKHFIYLKLREDITKLRQQIVQYPKTVKKSQYKKGFGNINNPTQDVSNIKEDAWLDLPAPSFESIEKTYKYDEIKVGKDFTDYEKIETPNGDFIEFNK